MGNSFCNTTPPDNRPAIYFFPVTYWQKLPDHILKQTKTHLGLSFVIFTELGNVHVFINVQRYMQNRAEGFVPVVEKYIDRNESYQIVVNNEYVDRESNNYLKTNVTDQQNDLKSFIRMFKQRIEENLRIHRSALQFQCEPVYIHKLSQ